MMNLPVGVAAADKVFLAIHKIEALINEGNSIYVARKKVFGRNDMTPFTREVTSHPDYVQVLNAYLAKTRRRNIRYGFNGTKLISIKKDQHG